MPVCLGGSPRKLVPTLTLEIIWMIAPRQTTAQEREGDSPAEQLRLFKFQLRPWPAFSRAGGSMFRQTQLAAEVQRQCHPLPPRQLISVSQLTHL